jgi:hypothetical protein
MIGDELTPEGITARVFAGQHDAVDAATTSQEAGTET